MKTYFAAALAAMLFATAATQGFAADKLDSAAKSVIAQRLQAQGVKVVGVEEWSGLIRAYVEDENGHQTMKLYTAGDLRPVERK